MQSKKLGDVLMKSISKILLLNAILVLPRSQMSAMEKDFRKLSLAPRTSSSASKKNFNRRKYVPKGSSSSLNSPVWHSFIKDGLSSSSSSSSSSSLEDKYAISDEENSDDIL